MWFLCRARGLPRQCGGRQVDAGSLTAGLDLAVVSVREADCNLLLQLHRLKTVQHASHGH